MEIREEIGGVPQWKPMDEENDEEEDLQSGAARGRQVGSRSAGQQ